MYIDNSKITGFQLTMLTAGFIQGSILLTSFTVNITKNDTWLVVITVLIISIPFSSMYAYLSKRFYNMNLGQINDAVFGPYIGKIISIMFLFRFFIDLSFNLRDLGDFYNLFLMTDTPVTFFIIIFTAVCGYSVYKGIEVLARLSHIFVVIALFIVTSTFLLLIGRMDFANLLPIFNIPFKKFFQGTHIISVVTFGEALAFLNVMNTVTEKKHLIRNYLRGVVIGIITLVVITIRNTSVLGVNETILVSPSFQAIRLINIGTIFNRMDILIGIGQTIMLFLKCSILFYSTVILTSQLFGLRSYKTLVFPIGGIAATIAFFIFESSVQHVEAGQGYSMTFDALFFFILLPLTLVIALIFNLPKKRKG